ncbi:MAG: hypothetical protein MMC33_004008 [Icmadophila ericetorum]|nr:hypothetical protein [Icmadophila ericetorum]
MSTVEDISGPDMQCYYDPFGSPCATALLDAPVPDFYCLPQPSHHHLNPFPSGHMHETILSPEQGFTDSLLTSFTTTTNPSQSSIANYNPGIYVQDCSNQNMSSYPIAQSFSYEEGDEGTSTNYARGLTKHHTLLQEPFQSIPYSIFSEFDQASYANDNGNFALNEAAFAKKYNKNNDEEDTEVDQSTDLQNRDVSRKRPRHGSLNQGMGFPTSHRHDFTVPEINNHNHPPTPQLSGSTNRQFIQTGKSCHKTDLPYQCLKCIDTASCKEPIEPPALFVDASLTDWTGLLRKYDLTEETLVQLQLFSSTSTYVWARESLSLALILQKEHSAMFGDVLDNLFASICPAVPEERWELHFYKFRACITVLYRLQVPKSDLKVESDAAAFVTHAITTHLIQMARDHWCSAFDGILEIHNARKVTARQKRLDLYDRVARHLGLTISLLDPLFEGSFHHLHGWIRMKELPRLVLKLRQIGHRFGQDRFEDGRYTKPAIANDHIVSITVELCQTNLGDTLRRRSLETDSLPCESNSVVAESKESRQERQLNEQISALHLKVEQLQLENQQLRARIQGYKLRARGGNALDFVVASRSQTEETAAPKTEPKSYWAAFLRRDMSATFGSKQDKSYVNQWIHPSLRNFPFPTSSDSTQKKPLEQRRAAGTRAMKYPQRRRDSLFAFFGHRRRPSDSTTEPCLSRAPPRASGNGGGMESSDDEEGAMQEVEKEEDDDEDEFWDREQEQPAASSVLGTF